MKKAIGFIGCIGRFSIPGKTYRVKPDLFTTIAAQRGAATYMRIVVALTEMLREAGVKPVVGECPAMASYARPDIVFDGLGVRRLCDKAGVELRVLDWEKPVRVGNPAGDVVDEFCFPEFALKCDGIINIPKLNTHVLTTLTCAVKNLFGLQQ